MCQGAPQSYKESKLRASYQSFWFKLEVSKVHVAREDANVEVLSVQVLHIFAEQSVEDARDCAFEHGGGF